MQKFIFHPFKLFSLLIFGVSLLFSQQVHAQCCSDTLVADSGFEIPIVKSIKFPNNVVTGASNSIVISPTVTPFPGSGYLYGTTLTQPDAYIVSDALRASEGAQFWYIPVPINEPGTTLCLTSKSVFSHTSSCAVRNLVTGKRYIASIDYAPFNKSVPNGGTGGGSTHPIFETTESDYTLISSVSMYNQTGTFITNEPAVAWANVKTSWKKASVVFTATNIMANVNFSIPSNTSAGILFDNSVVKPLQITDPGIGAVTCNGAKRVFILNPVSNVEGVPGLLYTVTAPSGYTISPSTGTYGQATTFTLTKTVGSAIGTGVLTVKLKDQVNTDCTLDAAIPDVTKPVVTITGTTNLDCNTTTVTRTASGGGTYAWSGGRGTNAIATITTAGTYTVTVTDPANSCTNTATTTVTGTTAQRNAGTDQAPTCVGTTPITTTTLAATAISGGAWTQAATNPAGAVVTTPASATSGVTGLNPGVYQFIWATSTTCRDTVQVTIPDCVPPVTSCDTTLTLTDTTICSGASTNLFALANGVKGTLTYSTDGTIWASLISPTNVTPSVTTTYFVKDSLSSTCIDIDTLVITVNPTPTAPSVTTPQIANCPVTTIDLTALSAALTPSVVGGVFEWHVSNSSSSAIVSNQTAVGAGTYYLFETSPAGCYSTDKAVDVQLKCCPLNTCVPITIVRN